jgi:dCMP deaminase
MRITLDQYALSLAEVAAQRSEDPFTKVGACVVRKDKSIAGLGYNGPPAGIAIDWENRDERRDRVIHAEINALRYVKPNEAAMIAVTLLPCRNCIQTIASYNIKKIIYAEVYLRDQMALQLAKEWGIELIKLKSFHF